MMAYGEGRNFVAWHNEQSLNTRYFICIICGLILACITGCRNQAADSVLASQHQQPTGQQDSVSPAQLEAILRAELQRLGKSPSDTTPHAPTGATNAAFDLAASVIDPDGPPDGLGGGLLPPTGVELKWTERLLGDYNLDGQVNAQDLAPLGINWQRTVAYDAAALHGGIAYWPTGDPLDDGGSAYPVPPATTSGAANWRMARIDGKEDGMLNGQDVTPIGLHWNEQSAGYRVYAKLPGETEFHVLPNPDNAASPLTIPRSKLFPPGQTKVDSTRPARFSFSYGDGVTALPDGRYEFYVSAYDIATNTDGPTSSHIALNVNAGEVNQYPVARLSLNPTFAGAPAVITFDASQSTDADGNIVEYRWDFDADGVVDWSTEDATVPDKSSGGEVDTITPGDPPGAELPPSTVTVTYERTAGYADYLYPRVTVVDDKGAVNARSAKLGVTGWEIVETLNSTLDAYDPPGDELVIANHDMGFEPGSGKLAVVGDYAAIGAGHEELAGCLLYGRREGPNAWNYEIIRAADQPLPDGMNGDLVLEQAKLFWDVAGRPMVVFCYYQYGGLNSLLDFRTYLARRTDSGAWELSVLFAGTQPDDAKGARGSGPEDITESAPGELHLLMYNQIATAVYGTYFYDYQYVTYKDGVISVEPIGWPEAEYPTRGAAGIFIDGGANPCVMLAPPDTDPTSIWRRRRITPGTWITERLDHGEMAALADSVFGDEPFVDQNDYLNLCTQFITGDMQDGIGDYISLVRIRSDAVMVMKIRDISGSNSRTMISTPWGVSIASNNRPINQPPRDWAVYHDLVQDDNSIITERPYLFNQSDTSSNADFQQVILGADGCLFAVISIQGGDYPGATVNLLMRRVDPRGTP